MSIYADNYIVDENTGEAKLIKHLNKCRVDRGTHLRRRKGWNKSGIKARYRKQWNHNKKIRVGIKFELKKY